MLSKTLQKIIDQKLTSAGEIGELTGKAPSTVYRWISGKSEPDFNSIRLLLRHLPNPRAQQAILSVFTAGTAWQAVRAEADLDVNADGCVDADDALDAAIKSVQSCGRSLRGIHQACKGGDLSPDATVSVVADLDEVMQCCHIARQVLVQVCETQQKRRKRLKLAK